MTRKQRLAKMTKATLAKLEAAITAAGLTIQHAEQ